MEFANLPFHLYYFFKLLFKFHNVDHVGLFIVGNSTKRYAIVPGLAVKESHSRTKKQYLEILRTYWLESFLFVTVAVSSLDRKEKNCGEEKVRGKQKMRLVLG